MEAKQSVGQVNGFTGGRSVGDRGQGGRASSHQQGLDTTTPSGRAMFGMLGVFAEFERAMIRERVHAGLSRARSAGKTLGRPKVSSEVETAITAARAEGLGIRRIARELGIGVSVVQRVVQEMAQGVSG